MGKLKQNVEQSRVHEGSPVVGKMWIVSRNHTLVGRRKP